MALIDIKVTDIGDFAVIERLVNPGDNGKANDDPRVVDRKSRPQARAVGRPGALEPLVASLKPRMMMPDQSNQPGQPPLPLRLTGLPPMVSGNTRLLVLGSFPGAASLARQQYYAHPQNQFWPILQAIFASSPCPDCASSYEQRSNWLLERGLGVWDVYASCERVGSLDAAIRQPQVNDFASLVQRCPQLRAIAHNGGESFKHARHTAALGWPVYKLPSTSPAHASWRFERKLAAWREVIGAAGLL